jgi:hypothetical protein
MELVDEDGFYMYEGEGSGKQMEVTEDHLPIGAEASQPEFAEEQNKAADTMKKKQYWGPIAGTRQSARTQGNAGKTMMELAQENKKRKNLDAPATSCFKGITTSNPFNILQQDTWKDRARTIGIVISDIVDGGTDESVPHTVIYVDSLPTNLDVDFTLSDI